MTSTQGLPAPAILRLEKSLLEAMDAALDEADWHALDDLLIILAGLARRSSLTEKAPTLH